MKKLFSVDLAVGALALAGLLSMIYLSLEVNDRGSVAGKTKEASAYFKSVSGLLPRTAVEVAGIAVGMIDSIELDGQKARVNMTLQDSIAIYKNAKLAVVDRGVLGDKVLTLDPGTPDAGLIDLSQVITNTSSGSGIEELTASLTETSKVLNEVLQSEEPKGALGKIILNLKDTTGSLKDIVHNNEDRIDAILAHVDQMSADLSYIARSNKYAIGEMVASLRDVSNLLKEKLQDGGDIDQATERLNRTLASIESISSKIDRGEGTIGKLINDDTTVNHLNEAIDNVNDTLGIVNRIELSLRYRGEFLTQVKDVQNLVALTIAPSPDKFLIAELISSPTGFQKVTNTSVSANGTVISETKTIQSSNNVQYSLLLGKRFWDLTVRAGILRNRGGLGFDYHLLKDSLSFSVDAFNFSRDNDRFQLRAYASWLLFKHFILSAGVDDVLTRNGDKNPFVGLGLQFKDNDFKALVPALGKGL